MLNSKLVTVKSYANRTGYCIAHDTVDPTANNICTRTDIQKQHILHLNNQLPMTVPTTQPNYAAQSKALLPICIPSH